MMNPSNRVWQSRCLLVIAVAFELATASLHGRQQPTAERVDVQRLGPQIGDRVPDFTLRDQRGQERTLASLLGRNGLMLVFFRSADW